MGISPGPRGWGLHHSRTLKLLRMKPAAPRERQRARSDSRRGGAHQRQLQLGVLEGPTEHSPARLHWL